MLNAAPYVLITGSSRGIGRATALAIARRGVGLALVGRDSPNLRSTAEAVSQVLSALPIAPHPTHAAALQYTCDLTDTAQIQSMASTLIAERGPPIAVIHNAGVIERARIEELSVEAWQRQIDVNLRAPFVLTRALLPSLRQGGRARLVFVGSISSTLGTAGSSAYCASKWGLVGFVKSLAEELSDSGLSCVAVLPGSVNTSMLSGSGYPARMQPEDVAQTLVHYALDAPLAHNGSVIEMFGI